MPLIYGYFFPAMWLTFMAYWWALLSRLAENQIVTDDSRRVTALDSASAG
jgi:uncharacterized protein (DUF2236 family)